MVFCFSTRSLLLFLLLHHRLQDSHCFTPPCSSPSPTAGPALHPHPHLRRTPVCLRSTVDDDDEELPAPRSRRRGRGWGGRGSEEEEEEADEREYLAARPEAFKKRLKVKRGSLAHLHRTWRDSLYLRIPEGLEVKKNKLPFGIPVIPQGLSAALLAGVFILGVGTGVTVDSAINTNPKDLASRDAIDKNAPNPKICQRYGASAVVLDQRVFVSFNPFNVFVTQADVKPGCVLRAANIQQVLQARGLLTDEEINSCKNAANTWGFVGELNDKPQLSCVYQSDDAQNEFLSNPRVGIGEDIYDNPGKPLPRKTPDMQS